MQKSSGTIKLRSPIGTLPKRAATHILIVSSVVTFVLTCWQMYTEWQKGLQTRHDNLIELETSFIPQLSFALWSMDTDQIELIITGIKNSSSASYIMIQDVSGQPPIVVGEPVTDSSIERSYILQTTAGEDEKKVGTMLVQIELKSFYQELWGRLWRILVGQAIKTFLVTFAIMLIIAHMITRHLVTIAEAADNTSKNLTQHTPVALDRKPGSKGDELDMLVTALNTLSINTRDFLQQLKSKNEERQLLQEELINATQRASVNQTVTGVLHDVNNFLSIVFGYIPMLQKYMSDASGFLPVPHQHRINEVVDKITKATDSAYQVANLHLRTFSLSSQATIIEVDTLIGSVLWIQERFFTKHGVAVSYLQPTGFKIFAMQGVVATILINLLKNAVEALSQAGFASAEPAKITISARFVAQERCVTIAVSDNGPGINDKRIAQIFNEGFTTKKEGYGIGLHFCHNLALRSGGNLTVASAGTGTGATFYLTLPSEDPNPRPTSY